MVILFCDIGKIRTIDATIDSLRTNAQGISEPQCKASCALANPWPSRSPLQRLPSLNLRPRMPPMPFGISELRPPHSRYGHPSATRIALALRVADLYSSQVDKEVRAFTGRPFSSGISGPIASTNRTGVFPHGTALQAPSRL